MTYTFKKKWGLSALLCLITLLFLATISSSHVSAAGDLTGMTASEITAQMGFGWNLGNTFDATGGNTSNIYSQETSWGNPKVTPELIKAVHDRGFNTIRIPVTWNKFIDKNNGYAIKPEFLARVKEVVDYAYDLDMFIILNLHHEAWVNTSTLDKSYVQVGEELEAVWSQLADYFADYDQHLIFEGMNEPRMAGTDIEWSGNQAAYNAINYLDQIFAFTIRNNGKGNNSERCLMIPGYAASSSKDILKTIAIPTYEGEAVNNIIISVHCYDPYNFCLSDEMVEFDPSNKNHTTSIDSLFKNLEELFLFNGIPVVIGETSATDKNNTEQRENWAEYMGKKATEYGIPIVIWDNGHNGHSGGECHAWISRQKCEWNYPSVLDKLFSAYESLEWGELTSTNKRAYDSLTPSASLIGGNIIWENPEGQVVAGIIYDHAQPISIQVIRSYITSSTDIAIAYSGNVSPLLYFSNSDDEIVTDGIEPYKTESKDDKKIAYYKFRTMNDALKAGDISNPSGANKMYIASSGADITIYEVDTASLNASVTYFAGGQTFGSLKGVETLPGLYVLGWYTTMDYRPGTEFNGEGKIDTTVYGKLCWEKDKAAMAKADIVTPTPIPTEEPKVTDQAEPTEEPSITPDTQVTDKPDNATDDKASVTPDTKDTDNNSSSDNSSGSNDSASGNKDENSSFPILLIFILLGAAVISGAVAVLVVYKSKKK